SRDSLSCPVAPAARRLQCPAMKSSPQPSSSDAVATLSVDEMRQRIRRRGHLKGRQPDDAALAEVRALLGPMPIGGWPRDRLIEHLHLLNDRFGGLHEDHLVALARETSVPMAEVYEV